MHNFFYRHRKSRFIVSFVIISSCILNAQCIIEHPHHHHPILSKPIDHHIHHYLGSRIDHNGIVSSQKWTEVDPSTDRGGLGLLILGYAAKICVYMFSYFKLMCLCLFLSLLFILLCPLIPFLIPALLLILVVGAALAVTIPLVSVAGSGGGGAGDGSVTVVTTGTGAAPGPTPPFQAIPAVFAN